MRMKFVVRPSVPSRLALSLLSLVVVLTFAIMASTQTRAQSAASRTSPASCTTTVISVNSTNQGDVFPGGVNASDTVVGSFQDLTTLINHGFQWSGGSGELYDYPGASQTGLAAINDGGVTVGSYTDSQGQSLGFLLKNGQAKSFSVGGAFNTFPSGINNHNVIVGTFEQFEGGPNTGFTMKGSTVTTIQFPGAESTTPLAVNDEGAVVGYYFDGSTEHGFLEYRNSYTKIEPAGASSSLARGINNAGEIVGEYRPSVNADGEGFTFLNGKFTSYVYPKATYTEFDGVNSLGDRTGDSITGRINGFLAGPGFLSKCR